MSIPKENIYPGAPKATGSIAQCEINNYVTIRDIVSSSYCIYSTRTMQVADAVLK